MSYYKKVGGGSLGHFRIFTSPTCKICGLVLQDPPPPPPVPPPPVISGLHVPSGKVTKCEERSDQLRGSEALPSGGRVWEGGCPPPRVGRFFPSSFEVPSLRVALERSAVDETFLTLYLIQNLGGGGRGTHIA